MKTLRARIVFTDEKRTVTAIESLEFHSRGAHRGRFMTGSLQPIAVIVREPNKSYALDMDAQPVDIDDLDLPADFEPE